MNKLREKLKERAEKQLNASVKRILLLANTIQDDTGIDAEDLLKIAAGGRCKTIEEANVRHLMSIAEDELLEKYNTQEDLPLDVDAEEETDEKESL